MLLIRSVRNDWNKVSNMYTICVLKRSGGNLLGMSNMLIYVWSWGGRISFHKIICTNPLTYHINHIYFTYVHQNGRNYWCYSRSWPLVFLNKDIPEIMKIHNYPIFSILLVCWSIPGSIHRPSTSTSHDIHFFVCVLT